jgi:hypothetical protein
LHAEQIRDPLILDTLSAWQWWIAGVVVAVGALIQAALGFGYALVAAPVLAVIAPQLVPGPVLLSACVLSAGIAARELRHVDARGVGWALLGRVPGAWLGATALALAPRSAFELTFGAIVLAAVWMSVAAPRVDRSSQTLVIAGIVSGVMGTIAAIGGPPIALVYQHEHGPRLRATLSAYFTLGSVVSLAALASAGQFETRQLLSAALMLPPIAVGFACAGVARTWLDAGRTRAGVLIVAAVSGAAVIVKAVF